MQVMPEGMNGSQLFNLPPEILEKLFKFFSSDVQQLKNISETCQKFCDIVSKVLKLKHYYQNSTKITPK